ncbi:MAG: DUF4465 domain-containing protein [Paludibacter sp.]|nr:DUF4465 domain-containing protein [Paludibacter sp.]
MKTNKIFLGLFASALAFTSCQNENDTIQTVVDFEDVTLDSTGYWDGSDMQGTYQAENVWGADVTVYANTLNTGNTVLYNSYIKEWYSWSGFACSTLTDSVTAGYTNQYSVYAGSGAAGSSTFGVIYDDAALICPADKNGTFEVSSAMVTNSTYTYLYIKNGDNGYGASDDSKYAAGDSLVLTITGYLSKQKTASVDYYLADFTSGKTFINNTWEQVDLSSLGQVDSVAFTFAASDSYAPTYACIDNIVFKQTVEK